MLSYPIKNGSYYDPRFTDVLTKGEVVALDEEADRIESEQIVKMITNIVNARTIAV